MKQQNNSTYSFFRTYFNIAIPLMLQGMVTKFVSMIDNLMVGQLGDIPIASVAMGNKILDIIMFTLFGVTATTSVFIAQYFGAKNKEKQQEVFRIGLIVSTIVLIFALMLFILFPKIVVNFFVSDVEIVQQTVSYLSIMIIGFIPFTYSLNYSGALRVIGQVKIPLIASVAGVMTNTVFNYLLIFGHFNFPALGIRGAAIATVLSRVIEFIIIFSITKYSHFDFNTKLRDLGQITSELTKTVIKKAIPSSVNEVLWSFGMATLLKMYGTKGSEVIAGLSIADTVLMIFYSFSQGMAGATPVLVSQKLGANQFDDAVKNAKRMVGMAVSGGLILGSALWFIGPQVVHLFQVSPDAKNYAIQFMQIMSFALWIYLVNAQCYFVIRSGGAMMTTLIMDGGYTWLFNIPVVAFMTYLTNLPIVPLYLLSQLSDSVKLIISATMVWRKKWVKNMTK